MTEKIYAKDCKCCVCGEPANAFWPCIDPDIPSHPYCWTCLRSAQIKVFIELMEAEKDDYYTSDCQKCGSRIKSYGPVDKPCECAYPEDCPVKKLND